MVGADDTRGRGRNREGRLEPAQAGRQGGGLGKSRWGWTQTPRRARATPHRRRREHRGAGARPPCSGRSPTGLQRVRARTGGSGRASQDDAGLPIVRPVRQLRRKLAHQVGAHPDDLAAARGAERQARSAGHSCAKIGLRVRANPSRPILKALGRSVGERGSASRERGGGDQQRQHDRGLSREAQKGDQDARDRDEDRRSHAEHPDAKPWYDQPEADVCKREAGFGRGDSCSRGGEPWRLRNHAWDPTRSDAEARASIALSCSMVSSGKAVLISGHEVRGKRSRCFHARAVPGRTPTALPKAAGPPLASMICEGEPGITVRVLHDVTLGAKAPVNQSSVMRRNVGP